MTNKMENKNDVAMEKNYTVYMHVCPNGKVYIGITRRKPELRWGKNGNGYKSNEYFWRAIQRYGWNNFEHEIIENNLTKEQAENMEIELIAKYRSNDREYGYNIESGGNAIGKHSIETKKKISDKCKFSKKTHCDGIIFNSLTECANYYRIKNCTMVSWVNNRYHMSSEFKEMNLRYATENDLNECEKYDINKHGDKCSDIKIIEHSKNVHCDNLIFNSITECANYYNLSASSISAWINGRNKMPLDFQKLNLRFATENDLNECEKYDINKHGDKCSDIKISDIKIIEHSKNVHCDNLIFNSIKECANYYRIKYSTIKGWLQGKRPINSDFQKLNLRYASNEDINNYERYDINKHGENANIVINVNKISKGMSKHVYCNGMIFNTISECANYYSIKMVTMSQWLRGKNKMPLDFQKLNLRYATDEDLNTYPRYTLVNN